MSCLSKKSSHILYSKLLYELGHDFLDIQYNKSCLEKIWVACCTLKKIFAEWWNVYLKKIFPLNTYVLYKCALWTTQSMQSVKDGWSALKLSRFFSLYFSDGWWVRSPCLFSCICYSKMQIVLTQPVCLCKVLKNIMNVSASDKLIALISCLFGLSSVCKAFA